MSPQKRTAIRSKLQRQLEEIRRLKEVQAKADMEWRAIQSGVVELLDELNIDSFTYEDDEGMKVKATKVQGSSLVFDEPQLKKALGAKAWKTVTRLVLDRTRLEDAVAEGRVDPVTIAECSSEKDSKPYIKLTAKASKRDQSTETQVSNRPGRKRGIPTS